MSVSRVTEWALVAGRWTRISRMTNFQLSDGHKSKSNPDPNSNSDSESDLVFVMIPGNPGNERFYEHFGQRILEISKSKFNNKAEFLTVSHLNHVQLPDNLHRSSKLGKDGKF